VQSVVCQVVIPEGRVAFQAVILPERGELHLSQGYVRIPRAALADHQRAGMSDATLFVGSPAIVGIQVVILCWLLEWCVQIIESQMAEVITIMGYHAVLS